MHRPLALSWLCLASWGCSLSTECSEDIGCPSGVNVVLSQAISGPGEYVVRLDREGRSTSCEVTLPGSCPGSSQVTCGSLSLAVTGCGSPTEQPAIVSISLAETPPFMTISIARDGQPFASTTATPAYVMASPEGPDCGTCRSARVSLEVPPTAAQ